MKKAYSPKDRIRMVKVSKGFYQVGRFHIVREAGKWTVNGARLPAALVGQRFTMRGAAYLAARDAELAAQVRRVA